jgi:hypothetical protein
MIENYIHIKIYCQVKFAQKVVFPSAAQNIEITVPLTAPVAFHWFEIWSPTGREEFVLRVSENMRLKRVLSSGI